MNGVHLLLLINMMGRDGSSRTVGGIGTRVLHGPGFYDILRAGCEPETCRPGPRNFFLHFDSGH